MTRGVVEILRHDWSIDSTRSVEKLNYRITPLETGIRALLSAEILTSRWRNLARRAVHLCEVSLKEKAGTC